MSYMGNMPDTYNLVINANHPVVSKVLDEAQEESQAKLISQLIDLAMLSKNLLKGEKLTSFIKRSVELI